MTEKVTAIVTGVGGGVGQSIIKGLKLSMQRRGDIQYKIIGTDADPLASGLYRTDIGYVVPKAKENGYIERLVEIANGEEADVIIPGSDPEVLEVAKNKGKVEEDANIKVLVSPADSVEIGLDKWRSFQFLEENGFLTPLTVLPDDADKLLKRKGFPVVIKPRRGSASRGLFIATNEEELDYALSHSSSGVILQEYLIPESWEGRKLDLDKLSRQIDEYSTEILVSKEGEILGSLSNWRKMVKGVPNIAKVKPFEKIRSACEEVVSNMNVLGPVNLQARITERGVTFFEINTRFTGSTAVRCVAGFNGPDTMIRNLVLGQQVQSEDLHFNNLIEMRYKNEVYISEEDLRKVKENGKIRDSGNTYEYF